jgi:hypothetical protein
MVCIDQFTGIRRAEPFSTLAKTKYRWESQIWQIFCTFSGRARGL